MGLDIIIVGAGIAGLCAAVSLSQGGHSVTVFEKSRFAVEIGAALLLVSNGSRVLSHLGFSFERARGRHIKAWDTVDGMTLANIGSLNLEDAEKRYGAPLMTVHRVDLHNELLHLASVDEQSGGSRKVNLRLKSKVVSADAEAGSIELEDGTVHRADLIVAADGVHSVLRPAVIGRKSPPVTETGMSAFRFLIPTETLMSDPIIAEFIKDWKCNGPTILADTKDLEKERHIVWYDCQGGEVQNLVGIVPSYSTAKQGEDQKAPMLKQFDHFHPNIIRVLEKAEDVTCWPLSIYDPLPTWSRDKIVLIGDAAHPMLPFGGQGSNQALEDAGALGILLSDATTPTTLPHSLEMFETVRRKRASRVQILSKVRVGKEQDVKRELEAYADPPGSDVPGTFAERNMHDYGFDVIERSREVLSSA